MIKEVYFLLKLTYLIEPGLQSHYLANIERLYDSHDRKKVNLASANLLEIYKKHEELSRRDPSSRPKTGIATAKSANFLTRPGTAIHKLYKTRPESSKFELKSTAVDSNDPITDPFSKLANI